MDVRNSRLPRSLAAREGAARALDGCWWYDEYDDTLVLYGALPPYDDDDWVLYVVAPAGDGRYDAAAPRMVGSPYPRSLYPMSRTAGTRGAARTGTLEDVVVVRVVVER